MNLQVKLDEEAIEILDRITACLIYTNKEEQVFNEKQAYEAYLEISKLIKLEELPGEHFVIYKMLENSAKIRLRKNIYPFKLSETLFDTNLQVGIERLLSVYEKNVIDIIERLGGNTDLSIPLNFQSGCSLVYSACLEKFKDLCNLQVKTEDVMSYIEQFKVKLKNLLIKVGIVTQSEILLNGLKLGKKLYKGSEGVEEFISIFPSLIANRFKSDNIFTKITEFRSVEDVKLFNQNNKYEVTPLFGMGFKPLDNVFQIRTCDIVTVVGSEGVGKTNFGVYQGINAIYAGKDVLYMCGESQELKIRNMFLSHHIFRKFGYRIKWSELADENFLAGLPEKVQKAIYYCDRDLVTNPKLGRLDTTLRFYYETFYDTMKSYCENNDNLGLVIIDHTDKLLSANTLTDVGYLKTQKEKVDYLFEQEIRCNASFSFAVLNIAHTSSDAAKAINVGKETGVRIGSNSGATSKDADIVILLKKDKDPFISVEVKKVRDFSDAIQPFLLKKDLSACNFIYSDAYQYNTELNDDLDEQID